MKNSKPSKSASVKLEKKIKILERRIEEVSRIAEIAFDLAKRAFGAWEFREVERQIKGTGEQ